LRAFPASISDPLTVYNALVAVLNHIVSVTQKQLDDVTLAALNEVDVRAPSYRVGTPFVVSWINHGEKEVTGHPSVSVAVIDPKELPKTWHEAQSMTTNNSTTTISYFNNETEDLGDVPIGDLFEVIPSELRTLAISNVSNDDKSMQLLVVAKQLDAKELIYEPPDMVCWDLIVQPPIKVSDAKIVVYRLYLQIIKNPFFQIRAGTALATDGHEEFLKVMAAGATPEEEARCRGMYYVRKSMLRDFLVQLRRVFPVKTMSDADRLGMLFDELVGAMHGINLEDLMEGSIETILLFLRWLALSLRTYFTFVYLIEQLMRGGFKEILPWTRMMLAYPLGVLSFLCADQNLNTPPYLMLCNQDMFTELGFPFPIQFYSLYACTFDSLVRYLQQFGGKMTDRALSDLRRVVDAYNTRFGLLPSPKKYKVWVRWLMERATSPTNEQIQRRLTTDFGR